MTDLTEKWKKGELLEGFYFVKCDWSDEVEIRYVHNGVDDWREVLAPVPSYEEWKASYNCMLENEVLRLENAQLKELLRKAKGIITAYRLTGNQDTYSNNDMKECVAKIEQALGEDKCYF